MPITRTFLLTIFITLLSTLTLLAQPVLDVRRVIINIEEGDNLGNYENRISPGESIQLPNDANIQYNHNFRYANSFREEYIQHQLSKALISEGFKIKGYGPVFKEFSKGKSPQFALAFYIDSLHFVYDEGSDYRFKEFKSNLYTRVEILDLQRLEIVSSRSFLSNHFSEIQGYDRRDNYNVTNYLVQAYQQLIHELVNDSEIKAILNEKQNTTYTPSFEKAIEIIQPENGTTSTIQEAINSTVTLSTGASHGSGAIISKDGLILTCEHNLDASEDIDVIYSNGIQAKAKVIRRVKEFDVALLQIMNIEAKPIPLNPDAKVNPTDETWVIGTPGYTELGQTVTKGVISGYRTIEDKEYLQTDASVSPGNSGGPLLNSDGEIIGIVNAKVVREGMEGIGFAIPLAIAMEKLNLNLSD